MSLPAPTVRPMRVRPSVRDEMASIGHNEISRVPRTSPPPHQERQMFDTPRDLRHSGVVRSLFALIRPRSRGPAAIVCGVALLAAWPDARR